MLQIPWNRLFRIQIWTKKVICFDSTKRPRAALFKCIEREVSNNFNTMTSVNDAMEDLGAVLMAGPAANRIKISKRRNVVDINWVPGAGQQVHADSSDLNRRLQNTSRLFDELKVSLRLLF